MRILPTLELLVIVVVARATYYYPSYPSYWPGGRWNTNERSGEDLYPGTYLGEGTAVWLRGYAELSCSLNLFEGYVVSNVVWSKMRGDFDEPFYPCPQCYPQDPRIRAYDHMGKSILMIRDPGHQDRGVYRCTATGQYTDGRLTTLYQVINLM